jgi:futalosine hydrolase
MSLLIAAATDLECALVRKHFRTVVTGVGAVAMAHALTVEIERERPAGIIVVGIGGAYPEAGARLSVGDVVCAESETFGDLGVETPGGFEELPEFIRNTYPLALFPAPRRARFVTVATCSGTGELSQRMQARTQGAVENMEGAAAAQMGAHYGIPVGEIRGISNHTGNRDRAAWKIPQAAHAAQEELLTWLRRWSMSLM